MGEPPGGGEADGKTGADGASALPRGGQSATPHPLAEGWTEREPGLQPVPGAKAKPEDQGG